MKTFKSFCKYLNRTHLQALNEDTMSVVFDKNQKPAIFNELIAFGKQSEDIVRGRWQDVKPEHIVKAMRISKYWNNEIGKGIIRDLPVDDNIIKQLERMNQNNDITITTNIKAGDEVQINVKFKQKQQGMLMGALKKAGIRSNIKFDNGMAHGIVYGEDNSKRAFHMMDSLFNDGKIPENIASTDDQLKELGLFEKYRQSVQKAAGNNQATATLEGPADIMAKYLTDSGVKDYKIQLTGNTKQITPDMIWLVDLLNENKADPVRFLNSLIQFKFGLMLRIFVNDTNKEYSKKIKDEKNKDAETLKISGEMSHLYKQLNGKTVQSIMKHFDKKANFNGDEKPANEKPELQKAAVRRMKLFDDAEELGAQVFRSKNWTGAICREFNQFHQFCRAKPKVKPGTNEIDPELNLNDRELAEKYKGDKKKIDEIKRKRDGFGEYVKDGICKLYDGQAFEGGWCVGGGNAKFGHNASLEWTWSKRNPFPNWNHVNVYFKARKPDERAPMDVIMDNRTGELYGFNVALYKMRDAINQGVKIGDNWILGDFNGEDNGWEGVKRGNGNAGQKLKNDPSFADMFWRIIDASFKGYAFEKDGKKQEWKPLTDPPPPHKPANPYEEMLKLELNESGFVVFKSVVEVQNNAELIKNGTIDEFKIAFENAENLFLERNLGSVLTIDCSDVKNLSNTFKNAALPETLNLVTTKNVTDFSSAFEDSHGIRHLIGLDTRSAETINSMLNNVETYDNYELVIPQLDLRKCKNLSKAFNNLNITNLQLVLDKNQHIDEAVDVITDCFRLKTAPIMLFDKKEGLGVFGKSVYNPIDIFRGCTKIQNNKDFDNVIKQYLDHYGAELDKTPEGYAVIRNIRDLKAYMQDILKYNRGIQIKCDDNEFTLADVKPLNVNVIDMKFVKNATSMFKGVQFDHIGKLINTENIEIADYMFEGSNITTTPIMSLPNVKSWYRIFNKCHRLKKIMDPPKRNKNGQLEYNYYTTFSIDRFQPPVEYENKPTEYCFSKEEFPTGLVMPSVEMWLNPYFQGIKLRKWKIFEDLHFKEENGKNVFEGKSSEVIRYMAGINVYGKNVRHADIIRITQFDITFKNLQLDIDSIIDLSKVNSITNGFTFTTFKNIKGFSGTNNIIFASSAFRYSRFIKCECRFFDGFQSLQQADSMFKVAICEDCKFDKKEILNMPNVVNVNELLSGSNIGLDQILPCEDIIMPKLQKACNMFFNTNYDIKITSDKKLLPGCRDIFGIFSYCSNIEVGNFSIDADNAGMMFFAAKLKNNTIGYINAPKLAAANDMFEETSLSEFGRMNAPNLTNMHHMFYNSSIKVIYDPTGFSDNADMTSIFENTPLADVYGKDGDILRLMLQAIKANA